ncbi:hypothetical protein DS742_16350 [Lacrimispora amygdalina]|uniref:Uncharacterized protein n=1 Tax=Lacrimispora amygdalina TaxID=253257 RepID=A0A3E2NA21_9FIRM|nr:DUF6361 family protein [Clostridium indicum]RFZ77822.1 hypothetical protein DS742_16350 [Clostridium indicum]
MQLGWIDFSRSERNKIIQTLKMLEESTALDELGIGVVRDGYADILFPGISTLQTRAKYFVLLPYLFAMAERQSFKRSSEILPWMHRQEDLLVPTLIKNSEDTTGVIGLRAHKQGKSVKVKSSSIYWNGMRTFEILRDEHLSISNVCNIIYGKQLRRNSVEIKTEAKSGGTEGFDDETAGNENMPLFSSITPDYAIMTEAAIELTKTEAEYLYQKMTTAVGSRASLLAFMLREKCLFPSFQDINEEILPDDLRRSVELAKAFAHFISGAHTRYNVIFSNGEDADQTERYREWQGTFDFDGFHLSDVLSRINGNLLTNAFLKEFYEVSKAGNDQAVDRLIIQREKSIKRERAKLGKPQEYRYDKPVHDYLLNYRYGTAYTIVNDILRGLEG